MAVAVLSASCVDYTGLGSDSIDYTKTGSMCLPSGATTCTAASCDDGTSAAAKLTEGSLECSYRDSLSSWGAAMAYCQGLGGGYRVPTKDRAFAAVLNSVVRSASSQQTWYALPSRHFEIGWHDRASATMAARSRSMLAATITHSAFAKDGWERDGSSGLSVRGRF